MEHTESSMTNPEKSSSDIHIRPDTIVGYRNDLSTDEIFYVEQPPPYESIETNIKHSEQRNAFVQAPTIKRHFCHRNRLRIIIALIISVILFVILIAVILAVVLRHGIPCEKSSASGTKNFAKYCVRISCYYFRKILQEISLCYECYVTSPFERYIRRFYIQILFISIYGKIEFRCDNILFR